MSSKFIRSELLDAGLHEESVNDMIEHYRDMRFHLSNENYVEAGAHVGNFCENLANVILDESGKGVDPHISVGSFLDDILNGNLPTGKLEYEVHNTIPRTMRVAYDLRNNRDSVHVNLDVEVNRSDTQTAVRLCTWMLAEMVRIYTGSKNRDEVARLIDQLAAPMTPYVDVYSGSRLVMSSDLSVREEVLVHLHSLGREADSDELADWIIDASHRQITGTLGRLKQERKAHYQDGSAKITPLGAEEAKAIIEENFGGKIPRIE